MFENKNYADLEYWVEACLDGIEDVSKEEVIKKIKADELCGLISNEEMNLLINRLMENSQQDFEEAKADECQGIYDENYKPEEKYDFDEGEYEEEEPEEGFMGMFEEKKSNEPFDFEESDFEEEDEEGGFESLMEDWEV